MLIPDEQKQKLPPPPRKADNWEHEEEELENQLNKSALWAVTYGDLMSYLMLFFMILFVFHASKSIEMQNALNSLEQAFGKEKVETVKEAVTVQELFSKYGLEKIAKVVVTLSKIRIIFSEPVLFDSGHADLKAACLPFLKELSLVLGALPNRIEIEGHTDNVPIRTRSFPSNWELSSARAFSVLRVLLQNGIPPGRVSASGYGEHHPVVPNDSPEARGKNRRIEINIVRQDFSLEAKQVK